MSSRDETGRLKRVKIWIPSLSLLPAAVFLARSNWTWAAGLAAGGIIILLNLLGTERTARQFVSGQGSGRLLVGLLQFAKLGLTAAAIAALIASGAVSPIALLLGLSSLPAALVFDFFIVPVNKGVGKKEP